MKKHSKWFLSIVFLAISMSGFSQFTFGPSIGTNFSNFAGKTSMKAGFDAGIFFRMGGFFYFEPGVEYSWSNSKLNNSINGEISNIKNHYLNVPLLLGFKVVNFNDFKLRLFVGPRLGFMLKNNCSEEDNPFGTMQIGGEAGLGLDLWRFTLDFAYNFSANQPNPKHHDNQWWKQNMVCISLGFKFIKD